MIYLVICYWGEYDDYTESIEFAFHNKRNAEKYIDKQDKRYVSYKIREVKFGD
jgi:hypothetical protein